MEDTSVDRATHQRIPFELMYYILFFFKDFFLFNFLSLTFFFFEV